MNKPIEKIMEMIDKFGETNQELGMYPAEGDTGKLDRKIKRQRKKIQSLIESLQHDSYSSGSDSGAFSENSRANFIPDGAWAEDYR